MTNIGVIPASADLSEHRAAFFVRANPSASRTIPGASGNDEVIPLNSASGSGSAWFNTGAATSTLNGHTWYGHSFMPQSAGTYLIAMQAQVTWNVQTVPTHARLLAHTNTTGALRSHVVVSASKLLTGGLLTLNGSMVLVFNGTTHFVQMRMNTLTEPSANLQGMVAGPTDTFMAVYRIGA